MHVLEHLVLLGIFFAATPTVQLYMVLNDLFILWCYFWVRWRTIELLTVSNRVTYLYLVDLLIFNKAIELSESSFLCTNIYIYNNNNLVQENFRFVCPIFLFFSFSCVVVMPYQNFPGWKLNFTICLIAELDYLSDKRLHARFCF
jgi:hypothetical protein